jgi:hypothetical protein
MRYTCFLGLAILLACELETEPPLLQPMDLPNASEGRLPEPDPSFRLSSLPEGAVDPMLDPRATEQFLARIHPAYREDLLFLFAPPEGGVAIFEVHLHDPELMDLLNAAWAPRWEHLGSSAIEEIHKAVRDGPYPPGLELARERVRGDRGEATPER